MFETRTFSILNSNSQGAGAELVCLTSRRWPVRHICYTLDGATIMTTGRDSPRLASRLHVVGQSDVVGPDVVLPLAQAQHATQHSPTVDAHSHVQVHVCSFHYRSVEKTSTSFTFFFLQLNDWLLQTKNVLQRLVIKYQNFWSSKVGACCGRVVKATNFGF